MGKKETVTDTFVSITVSVMGIDPNFNRILFLGCIPPFGWGAFCVLGCKWGAILVFVIIVGSNDFGDTFDPGHQDLNE